MVISTRPTRRRAALMASLLFALSTALATDQRPPLPDGMLDAGAQSDHVFGVEARTIVRNGDLVRFRLLAVNRYGGSDSYDARVEVDCAHRTRRELSGLSNDGHDALHSFEGETGVHDVAPHTRADKELQLVCSHAALDVAAATRATPSVAASQPRWQNEPLLPKPVATDKSPDKNRPHLIAPSADIVDAGSDGAGAYAILIDSVHHDGAYTSYVIQNSTADATWATWQRYVVDCSRRVRAFQPEDSASGARLSATHVAARSREARELATACAMPQGPRARWFAGFVVTSDGVVVAPHERTARCTGFSIGSGAQRRALTLIGHEEDVTLLRIPGGGPWPVMPALDAPSIGSHVPVTMMGVAGTAPRVSAAFATATGSNPDDPGWPQVLTLKPLALNEGIVWNTDGAAIGLALASAGGDSRHAFVRMLPVSAIRARLARHGLNWQGSGARALDAEAAMRLALATTVPLFCEHANRADNEQGGNR